MKKIQSLLAEIGQLKSGLRAKDFLLTWEQTPAELRQVLMLADAIKRMRARNIDTRVFDTGLAVSIFRDKSTRTRFSFASAANLLGLDAVRTSTRSKSQIAHGETVRETANMISLPAPRSSASATTCSWARATRYMREVGAALDDGFAAGRAAPQRPAVVNLQCDIDHPTQTHGRPRLAARSTSAASRSCAARRSP